jgi:hypothetical protein
MHHQVTRTGKDSKDALDAVLLAFPTRVRPDEADCVGLGWHAECQAMYHRRESRGGSHGRFRR